MDASLDESLNRRVVEFSISTPEGKSSIEKQEIRLILDRGRNAKGLGLGLAVA